MNAEWLSLHVFCDHEQDSCLLQSVHPALETLRVEGKIERFFFIRYWNGGPHLRVRVECRTTQVEVEYRLRSALTNFFADRGMIDPDLTRYASDAANISAIERRLGAEPGTIETVEPVRAAGSIDRRIYRFDADRYGAANTDDTHRHFWVSSQIALAVLGLGPAKAGHIRMFALHAAALVSGFLSGGPRLAETLFKEASHWVHEGDADTYWTGRGFASISSQRPGLASVEALLNGIQPDDGDVWGMLLTAWNAELQQRCEFLRAAKSADPSFVEPDHLMLDAMHMFNNRLGLTVSVECYIYHLIAGLLSSGTL